MILISPELLYILRARKVVSQRSVSDPEKVRYSISIHDLPDEYSRGRLVRNLRNLEGLGILRIVYLSSRVVEIETFRKIIDLLHELSSLRVDECKFEFNALGLKCLFSLLTCPYDRNVNAISDILGISIKGVRKCIRKLMCFRFVDDKLDLTDTGLRVVDMFIRSPLMQDVSLSLVVNPFLSLPLTPPKFSLEGLVDNILGIIKDIIKLNGKEGIHFDDIFLISISDSHRLSSLMDSISELLDIPTSVMPIRFSKAKINNLIIRASIIETKKFDMACKMQYNNILRLIDITPSEIKYVAEIINNVTGENTLTILFSPYVLIRNINHILSLSKTTYKTHIFPRGTFNRILAFFRLDEDLMFLVNDIGEIGRLRDLHHELKDAFENARKITIYWNKNTDYPSYINIKIKRKIDDATKLFTLEDGSFTSRNFFVVPLGELKIHNIHMLARNRIVEVSGEINILGEPIIGLKRPKDKWIVEKLDRPELTLSITDMNHRIIVKKSKYNYLKLILDGKAFIESIHFGGNSTKYGHYREYRSPIILSRTKHFIHILLAAPTLINQDILTFYHLLINDAEVLVDEETIWKTH